MRGLVVLLSALLLLSGCGGRLPLDAKEALFEEFDAGDRPRIDSVRRVDPSSVDVDAGAAEVYCVNVTFYCWTYPYNFNDRGICGESRLVRMIEGRWEISVVATEADRAGWEARGCELMPSHIQAE